MKHRFWGFILLVLGVLILLQLTGVYNLGLSFWPVVLLLFGITILWQSISHGFNSWFLLGLGLWVGGIGLFGILSTAGVSSIGSSEIARYGWPLLLVAIGLSLLIGNRGWFSGWRGCGAWAKDKKWEGCSRMRHVGDLYHGRVPWVLDKDLDFYHGIGDVVIDLTTAEIRPGSHKIFVKTGIGEVTIRVPGGVNLDVDASGGLGELNLFGEQRSGFAGLALSKVIEVDGAEAAVQIEAKLGIGEMTVLYLPAIPGASK